LQEKYPLEREARFTPGLDLTVTRDEEIFCVRVGLSYRIRMYTSGMDEKRISEESESEHLEGLYRKASDPVFAPTC